MKPDEHVTDYILRFRQTVSRVGAKKISDDLQAFLFVMNLTAELKEECGTQPNGKPWPTLSSAIEAAIGAQRRVKTAQTGKRAKLAAVHAVDCEQDNAVCDEHQDAGDDYQCFQQEGYGDGDAEMYTLAAVQQRRPGPPTLNPAQRKQQSSYNNQNRSSSYGNRSNYQSNSSGNNRQQYNAAPTTRSDQQVPAAKTFEELKRMVRATCELQGWCYSCMSDKHTTARCDGSGPLGKALPRMNTKQQH